MQVKSVRAEHKRSSTPHATSFLTSNRILSTKYFCPRIPPSYRTMSSLLQSILSSKLSNATIDDAQDGLSSADSGGVPSTHHRLDDWEEVNTSDDEQLVGVQTAPGTRPGSPSRPSTPSTTASSATATKPKSSLSHDRPVKVKAPKSKTDPLRSLPKEVSQM